MTVDEILTQEALRHHEFPVTRERVFLAHAAVCPLPRRVADAVSAYATAATLDDQETPGAHGWIRETRELAARLVGAEADEIALVGPTSLALSYVAAGFPLRKGDNILVYFDDYPSNVYPWMALDRKGVEVRLLPARELGRIEVRDLLSLVDENTRLVAVASCHFISGWRMDLPALGRALKDRRVALCLDAIQTLGAFPTLAEHADFIAADAHKWLLGPCGAGFLYVSRRWHEGLRPMVYGWHNVRCPDFVAKEEIAFRSGAARYEAGSHSVLGIAGLRASLQLILEVGVEAIGAELLRKRAWLTRELTVRGWDVLGVGAPEERQSGIVTFHRKETDMAAVHEQLKARGVVASLRMDRGGRRYVRFSPHFYNTDAELGRAIEALPSV